MQHDFKYSLTLSAEQLQVVNDCLMFGPYGKVAPVVSEINEQLKAQMQKQSEDKTYA